MEKNPTPKHDHFKKDVIAELRESVACFCSNPECLKLTACASYGSNVDKGSTIMGEAAHICARSTKGPRNEKKMSNSDRKAFSNGIWLCSNCHAMIDKSENIKHYTAEMLKEWKAKAEKRAQDNHNERMFSVREKDNEVRKTLVTALTESVNPPENAIQNIHRSVETCYEKLDSRFSIASSFIDGNSHLKISAKEPFDFKFTLKFNNNSQANDFEDYLNYGKDLKIPTDICYIEGSPLFEKINKPGGEIKFTKKATKAIQKVTLISSETNEYIYFDEIHGNITVGEKGFIFEGTCLGNHFIFKIRLNPLERTKNAKVSFCIDVDKWNKINLVDLPYFHKLYEFYEKLNNGWDLDFSIEIQGKEIISKTIYNEIICEFSRHWYILLEYINNLREISQIIKTNFFFDANSQINKSDYNETIQLKKRLTHKEVLTSDMIEWPFVVTAVGSSENIEKLKKINCLGDSDITKQQYLNCFGKKYKLPALKISLKKIIPEIQNEISEKEEIVINYNPTDETEIHMEYLID